MELTVKNTTVDDLEAIVWLFEKAMELKRDEGYKVWKGIDIVGIGKEIERKLHYKIESHNVAVCIFSIQFEDPYIWRTRDPKNAIYIHRIVVHPDYKGNRIFQHVLNRATQFASDKGFKFVRLDTWADNHKLIEYYKSFGFKFVENFKTGNEQELPVQNRNLNIVLLEKKIPQAKN